MMQRMSVTQRYSAYGVVLSILSFFFIWWLLLLWMSPEVKVAVKEPQLIEQPVYTPEYDPYQAARSEARNSGLDPRLVVALIKSEKMLMPHKELEGACSLENDQTACIQTLGKTNKTLTDLFNRKPTPSDVLLAHVFGVSEAHRINQLPGGAPVKDLGEEILDKNPNLSGFSTVRDFRIWLRRAVYKKMY